MTYESLLENLIKEDERFVVMTAENRAAIRNLPARIGKRFIDTGITEQTMIGMAAGLALRGRIPVVHALTTFLTMRAFEFIRTDIGIAHAPVKLVGYVPGFLSEANGPTHQAIEDVSIMRSIPGMRIFCPADVEDMLIGLRSILNDPHPWYIRYNDKNAVSSHLKNFEIGKSEIVSHGKDLTIMVYGYVYREAYQAAEILRKQGYTVQLMNMRSLEPVDEKAILEAVENTSAIITIEDHLIRGGLYTILAEILLKNGISTRVIPLALENKWFKPALIQDVLAYEGFTASQIAEKIKKSITKTEQQYA